MRRFVQRQLRFLVIAGTCGLLAAASPLWARFQLRAFSTQDIDGVDSLGNPDPTLGGESVGKVFKDSRTGVILQINRALVENEIGRSLVFRNRGLTMFDPETFDDDDPLTSTSDYTLIFERTAIFQGTVDETGWGAVEVKIFDPAAPALPQPVPVP